MQMPLLRLGPGWTMGASDFPDVPESRTKMTTAKPTSGNTSGQRGPELSPIPPAPWVDARTHNSPPSSAALEPSCLS